MSILVFNNVWNDFLWPLIVISDEHLFVLTLALPSLTGPYGSEYGLILAGALLASLPVILPFIFLQRQFIEGLMAGELKTEGEKSMADWISGDCTANGIRIHYSRTGGDKPPLVLSHGATDSGLCWTRVARALEADYDIIMPDARGHGLSDAPDRGYTSEERAADLAGLIQSLGLTKPALGGHSMGAQTTFQLVATAPHLARCAILEDPGFRLMPGQSPESAPPAGASRLREMVLEMKSHTRDEMIALCRQRSPNWDEEELGPWADAKIQVSEKFLTAMRPPSETPWWELLPKVTCLTLLVTADPDKGAIVTPEVAKEAERINQRLRAIRLPGAGHNIRRERFDGFVPAVRSFLAETRG